MIQVVDADLVFEVAICGLSDFLDAEEILYSRADALSEYVDE